MEHNMNQFISKHRRLSLVLVFTSFLTATNLAVAQQITEEVIVSAQTERVVDISPVGSPLKVQNIEINRHVSISDLDLSNSVDAEEFVARITAIAEESCQELSKMFPHNPSKPMEISKCVKRAVASVEKQTGADITARY